MNVLIALIPLAVVFGLAALLGVVVARVSASDKPALARWSAHPWPWFFVSQSAACLILIIPSLLWVFVICSLTVALPSAVQGLRLASEHSSVRYWLIVGLGLVVVMAVRLLPSLRGQPTQTTLFGSPLVLLPWMLAARIARRTAISKRPAHEAQPAEGA